MNQWDEYFFEICIAVAKNSKCLSRKIGAIIVRDKTIISTGKNGPPKGVPHCDEATGYCECPRRRAGYKSGEGLEYCPAGHAERNAIVNAARVGISIDGATMYMTCSIPCKDCLIEIINSGIQEIVVTGFTFYDNLSMWLLSESDLKVRDYEGNIWLSEK